MLANELRQKYIEFFQGKGHLHVPRAPLDPHDALGNPDTSSLFTLAGMQQFKPYFAGEATPPHTRLLTVQPCVRTIDIDVVGDYSHCTLFEMLGNFSFGDYFKAEVIPWTWEFLTEWLKLDPERICVTIFLEDEEAYDIWHNVIGLPADRIHRLGEDKNYWPAGVISAGPDGPCGPCSEIFYRVAPLEEMTTDPNLTPTERYKIDDDAGRWLEIWNNVFTQYDRSEDAHGKPILTPLPKKNNDTGAGFDRLVMAVQGKPSVFETDLFRPVLAEVEALAGQTYGGTMEPRDFAFRVVAEHTRMMAFCIADGILPSNEGRGYVLRYVMRRAIRYGKTILEFDEPFLYRIAPKVIEQMGDYYTELRERQDLILSTIRSEEERFLRTLDHGMARLEEILSGPVFVPRVIVSQPPTQPDRGRSTIVGPLPVGPRINVESKDEGNVGRGHRGRPQDVAAEPKVLSGDDAFMLYDTYGFPLELTKDIAAEHGVEVDMAGFGKAMAEQRRRSREASDLGKSVFVASEWYQQQQRDHYAALEAQASRKNVDPATIATEFVGYDLLAVEATIKVMTMMVDSLAKVVDTARAGDRVTLTLDRTPFYAEAGGQVGDTGWLTAPAGDTTCALKIEIRDTKKAGALYLHDAVVLEGEATTGQAVHAAVDATRRADIRRNHTATHLLQAALREVLGGHVHQKGSLVAPDRLRFDFTHAQAMTAEELGRVEEIVNAHVLDDTPVKVHTDVAIAEAKARGAMALFGEKYGERVRMIEIPGFSIELCGGTHLAHTSQVGLFKITGESGVSAGVRRIEAVTGRGAIAFVNAAAQRLEEVAHLLKTNPTDVLTAAEKLVQQRSQLEKQVHQLRTGAAGAASDLHAREVAGVALVTGQVANADVEALAALADRTAQKQGSAVVVLGGASDGKVFFVAKVTPDLVKRGFHAGNLVREVAKVAGGGGGGRPDFAQAGGRDPGKLEAALQKAVELIEEQAGK